MPIALRRPEIRRLKCSRVDHESIDDDGWVDLVEM